MNGPSKADRLTAMAALLEKEGIGFDGVAVAGVDGDVAVVRTRDVDADRLGAIATRIKALGFRYVTIDLERHAGESP